MKTSILAMMTIVAAITTVFSAEGERSHSDKINKQENKVIVKDGTQKGDVSLNEEVRCIDDAFIKQKGSRWEFGTSKVKRIVALENGKLFLKSFKNLISGAEFAPQGAGSEEFAFSIGESGAFAEPYDLSGVALAKTEAKICGNLRRQGYGGQEPQGMAKKGNRVTSADGGWKLIGSTEKTHKQGERQLDIILEQNGIQVTKSYMIYPGSSIIREWIAFKNTGKTPVQIVEPTFLDFTAKIGDVPALPSVDFHWMTGGACFPGSWKLVTESLNAGKPITFDSYAPYPYDGIRGHDGFPGDGVNVKILLNDTQVWPATGWQCASNAITTVNIDASADVKASDKLVFLVNINKNDRYDTTDFDPTIVYNDGESHTASQEFSDKQGTNGWQYQGQDGKGKFVDLIYSDGDKQWQKQLEEGLGGDKSLFIRAGKQCPKAGMDAALVWTAKKSGHIRIIGSVCNIGNCKNAGYKPGRQGTASYAPWYALYNKQTKDGMFIGWDYFGHWGSSFMPEPDGTIKVALKVAGHKQTLAPGDSFVTPKAFVGLFQDDLDNAGNECLDWQYRYLWDYAREGWFPAIRMCGYWSKGTGYWSDPIRGNNIKSSEIKGWLGGGADQESAFRKVFRVADLMRYCGADVYHRDWGWWDCAGDWNGPDFKATGKYLRKYGMGQLIYTFPYTVDKKSRVAQEHPDWLLKGDCLDMSKPEVVEFIKGQLDMFVERWGDFEWRNDSTFTAPHKGDDTPLLAQDQGFRQILREFLDKHPGCAFNAVNGGGMYGGYDYIRYASVFDFTDDFGGMVRMNHYISLLFPPDKTAHCSTSSLTANHYDKAKCRGLLCVNFAVDKDNGDSLKLEGIRELIDIYHYLHSKGVVGRWVKVYRPVVIGDDPTMYFQRLSRDRTRGIIIPKHPAPGSVTMKPKGLLPNETYFVSFHESQASEERKGADLMESGIRLKKMLPGELIYLNLPLHPGSKLDTEPPTPPSEISKQAGENMGYPGVELTWKPGSDNNWVSCYEIFRNGLLLDKVAKGTFYFDHSAGADQSAKYEVRTVDGAGNFSAKTATKDTGKKPAQVFDDAPGQGFVYKGEWKHQTNVPPAHAGTLSFSDQKGATAELVFEGKTVLLFTKLGPDCGKAAVSIDGSAPDIVDTYSADDIWGIGIYRKELAAAGRHTLRIEVIGERFEHPTYHVKNPDTIVHIDGVRVELE